MVFVDGENFAIRYKEVLGEKVKSSHVNYLPDIFLWSSILDKVCHNYFKVIRKYYYTSVKGDQDKIDEIEDLIKSNNIDAPRVFKKSRNGKTKRVDISLSTDMLFHATKKNYDVALLIAGDEDYVPLIEAVQSEGCRVFVWFFSNGLSRSLRVKCDKFIDITKFMLGDDFLLV
ncbi:MAG: NYN domain-containing protein [Melioribacteraceae bacterium]|nr:NYN domain-containing protein [Melioribacteraceae bacterium]